MKPNRRRKLIRRSFIAMVTGTSALALQACGGSDSAQDSGGNNTTQPAEQPTDSDSG